MNTAYLVLADGTVYQGTSFGTPPLRPNELAAALISGCGEVVFNTSMTGYHEILTDPSYTGQIVLMTYPHIGNYGTEKTWSEGGPQQRKGSKEIKASGLVVRDYYDGPLPPGRESLDSFMKREGISGISDIDTRRLTLSLRDQGSQNGVIVASDQDKMTEEGLALVLSWLKARPSMEGQNLITDVGTQRTMTINEKGSFKMGLVDYGIKNSIIDELVKRDVQVTLFPSDITYQEISTAGIQALFLSNGPGDPAVLTPQIELIKQCIGKMPIYGICLGHQLIANAIGAKTYKMTFGHHGGNHPVRDEETGKVFVTSQNHGFAVEAECLPEEISCWFINANDGSVEGLKHNTLPIMSVQFHPEASPGPHDGSWFFDAVLTQAQQS